MALEMCVCVWIQLFVVHGNVREVVKVVIRCVGDDLFHFHKTIASHAFGGSAEDGKIV